MEMTAAGIVGLVLGLVGGFLLAAYISGRCDDSVEETGIWIHRKKAYRLTPLDMDPKP